MKVIKIAGIACCLNVFLISNIFCMKAVVQVVFPGVQPLRLKMLEFINGETTRIDFAQYALLHPEIVSALTCAASRGVKVSGVIDQSSIDQIGKHILLKDKHAQSSEALLSFLKHNQIDIYAKYGHAMHNKIMCFAQNYTTCEPAVITGSANCTVSGLNSVYDPALDKDSSHNFENLLIISGSYEIYEQYRQEINRIKMEVARQERKRCKRDEK